jgi:hypothetical protein
MRKRFVSMAYGKGLHPVLWVYLIGLPQEWLIRTPLRNPFIWVYLIVLSLLISCQVAERSPQDEVGAPVENPTPEGARYPNLYADGSGTVFLSWLQPTETDSFSVMYSAIEDGDTGKTGIRTSLPAVTHRSNDYFVNWADFPSVIGYQGQPLAAHWLKKVEGGTYAYHVQIAFFDATSGVWGEPITPHLDRSPTEHGFVSLLALDADRILAVWLDGRQMGAAGHAHGPDQHHQEDHDIIADLSTAMTLRSAEIHRNGRISRKNTIDAAVCECCATALTQIPGGAVVVYRNRDAYEIRDIWSARYDFETGQWSDPAAVSEDGWKIGGCPVNGPRVAARGDTVAVSWFTAAGDDMRTQVAVSDDGGRSFSEAVRLSEGPSIGRTDILIGADGGIWASWVESRTQAAQAEDAYGGAKLMAQRFDVKQEGEHARLVPGSEAVWVGSVNPTRRSGFPRMAGLRDGILFAWTRTEPELAVEMRMMNGY